MAYQALYRKYRPRTFGDFDDQDNVKKILCNSIKNNKISHAYLFSGPRGIGKTSMAKIFAKAINCLDFDKNGDICDKCKNCDEVNHNTVDIIEMDAASNNGVEQIRDLRNKVSIVPSKLKYKVYIIDEVHMLTNSAFNALLKTLEEPPAHVVFILATTEFYEVPETIVSRCQCFSFSRITNENLIKRLKYIAEMEKIDIDDDAITEIAHYSNGGFRDAIGMLDKLHSFTNERITSEVFKNINGMISLSEIESFYNDIFDKKLSDILQMIEKINNQGYDFKDFIERLMLYIRDKVVNYYVKKSALKGLVEDNIELISVLNDILNRLKSATDPVVIVQIYLLKYIENVQKQENISREIKLEVVSNNKIDNQNINNVALKEKEPKSDSLKSKESDKIISREIKNVQKSLENNNSISINEENKRIRINNSMATANISYKKELNMIWNQLNRYFMDDKYGKVSQLLSDTVPMVVGSEYAIFTTESDSFINNIYMNLAVVEDFVNTIYRKLSIVVVRNDEFEIIKNKYIEDKKNNIIYHVMEERGKLVDVNNNLINQALNVFGTDLVEIE